MKRKLTRDEVLFQVKRLYALNDLMISDANSANQFSEASFAFTRYENELSKRFKSPLRDYIMWEGDTVESCTDKVMKNLEKSEDDK